MRRLLPYLAAVALVVAHPMGNFSVSHYTRLEATVGGLRVTYALDLAEIPTFELLRDWKLDAKSPREQLERRATEQARAWAANLDFRAGGRKIEPKVLGADLVLSDGAGGLAVARITARLELDAAPGRMEFEDRNFSERAGWKEIVIATSEGARLIKASHGATDRSKALSEYPADPTIAPPQDLRAALEWTAERPATEPAVIQPITQPAPLPAPATPANAAATGTVVKGDFLSQMLGHRDLTLGMILLGLAVAFGLGAMHALSPGHGKTIVAAYLVGSHGTAKHAAFLGAMVTFTHTASVFLLGLGTLFLSEYIVPEKVFPTLGAISGLSILLIGATLFYKRLRRLRHAAAHAHHHHHHHHDHDHDHHHVPQGDVTMAGLIALGASGGLVPCPSALVLLLSSVALGRVGLGLILLVAFSLGLAGVLMAIGMLVLYAKHLVPDPAGASRSGFFRLAPVLSAAVIAIVGAIMTGVALGWVRPGRLLG